MVGLYRYHRRPSHRGVQYSCFRNPFSSISWIPHKNSTFLLAEEERNGHALDVPIQIDQTEAVSVVSEYLPTTNFRRDF